MIDQTDNPSKPTAEVLDKLVRRHMMAGFTAGVIPIPVMDIAAVTAVQLNLVRKLSDAYDVPFSKHAVRNLIGAIVGGALPIYSAPVLAGLVKAVPLIGTTLGVLTMPLMAAGAVYAVGHLFIEHFEAGGTLLTLDLEKARERFQNLFVRGTQIARNMKRDGTFDDAHKSGPEDWGNTHGESDDSRTVSEDDLPTMSDLGSSKKPNRNRRPPDFD